MAGRSAARRGARGGGLAWALGLVFGIVGIACGEGATPTPERWQVELEGLHAAALAMAEGEDGRLWVVGADKKDGRGPLFLSRAPGAESWEAVSLGGADPEGGHLWWVTTTRDAVWAVGEGGRAFRIDGAGRVARIPTGTEAALYGIWGEDDAALWAVGGHVYPSEGPPVIVRIAGGVGEPLPAPLDDWPTQGTLFKVWGAGASDVLAVGERGLVLRWDGARWAREALDGAPRLVTVHGRGARRVAVGGASQAVMLEKDGGGAWVDTSPPGRPLLSGVFVGAERTCAVGMLGAIVCRDGTGDLELAPPPVAADWHAALIDRRGDLWVVGGNLLSAARMDGGTVLRLGRGGEPAAAPDFPDATGDTTGPPEDGRGDDTEGGDTDGAGPEVEVADALTPPDDLGPADSEANDTGPELPDGAEDVPDDAPAPGDAWIPPPPLPADVSMFVRIDAPEGPRLERLEDGSEVPLVHGPQGGFHIEVVVRVTGLGEPGSDTRLDALLGAWTRVDGVEVAGFTPVAVPFWPNGDGTWETTTLLLVFVRDPAGGAAISTAVDGKEAWVGLSLETAAGPREGAVRVRLHDTL